MSKRYSKKRYVYDKAAIQYYKQVPFPCSIKGRKVNYFFQLNSLLEIYEDNFFLNTIFTDKAQIFIDIGANVGRISSLASTYGTFQKIFALDANPHCITFIKTYIPQHIVQNITALSYGIGTSTQTATMTVGADTLLNPCGTLCIEKSALTDEVRKNEIPVKIKSFKEFFIENNLDIYISFLIKIDVEGFEKEVLHSLISFIRLQKEKYCVKIIVEILPQNYEEMSQFLKEHQITISQLGDSDDYVLTL